MTAGLPGIGIGGIFYLLCAFLMPVVEFLNFLRGKGNLKRWQTALVQFGFSCAILGSFWLTGIVVERSILWVNARLGIPADPFHNTPLFRVQNIWLSIILLLSVLFGIHVINFLSGLRIKKLVKLIPLIRIKFPRLILGR